MGLLLMMCLERDLLFVCSVVGSFFSLFFCSVVCWVFVGIRYLSLAGVAGIGWV